MSPCLLHRFVDLAHTVRWLALAGLLLSAASAPGQQPTERPSTAKPPTPTQVPDPAANSDGSGGPGPAVDGGASSDPAASGMTLEQLRSRLQAVEAQQDTSSETRTKLVEYLTQAVAAAERTEALTKETARLVEEQRRAPARRDEIRAELAKPMAELVAAELGASVDREGAEAALRKAETTTTAARQQVQVLSDAVALQRQRPEQIRSIVAESNARLGRIAAELNAATPVGEPPAVTEARRAALIARQRMRTAEVAALQQELSAHDQRLGLLSAELDLAQRKVTEAEAAREAWGSVVQRSREQEAASKAREAQATEQAMAQMPASIRTLAESNTALAAQLRDLTAKEAQIGQDLAQAEARLKSVEEDLLAVQQRVELAGLNETLALVLRKTRDKLPSMASYERKAARVRTETSWAAGVQIDAETAGRDLVDPARRARRVLEALNPPLPPAIVTFLLPRVTDVLRQRKELTDKLYEGSGRYIKQLGKLDNAERSLLSRAETFNRLIDEHLLWIRSAPVLDYEVVLQAGSAAVNLLAPGQWLDFWQRVLTDIVRRPGRWVVGIAAVVLLIAFRPRATNLLRSSVDGVGRARRDTITLTLKALAATAVLALAGPAIPAALSWPLFGSEVAFDRAVGQGMLAIMVVLLGFSFLKQLARNGGVGDVHFGWPAAARGSLRAQLRWLTPVAMLLGFVIGIAESGDDELLRNSLGRVAFLLAMLALSVFLARLLAPGGPVVTAMAAGSKGLFVRLRHVWIAIAVAAPLVVGGLSVAGFHYSAIALQNRLQATAWLVIALVLAADFMMRWVTITQRRMAYERARDERLAQRQARQEAGEVVEPEVDETEGLEVAEPEVTVADVQDQAGSVIRTVIAASAVIGLWAIWAAVLPALSGLQSVDLWTRPDLVDGVEKLVPVTLVDVAFALLVGVIAWVATKNLPGALELTVLNRTALEAGAKYAFTTLCRYAIVGTGIITVFNLLGMQWSQLQWLVAALSVGLGFGLQEIVANFVSGIILLFERPIRVGDVVTVGGKDGVISRIQIRATTLVDWDRKEVIVPNKTFITGDVINWTLTNATNRIYLPVGVAYGSDTKRAIEILLQVAENHPRILADPPPLATFEGFGDNTLNLILRCYMPNLDGRLGVITDLHSGIDEAFKEAGISIAFPQRDVHLQMGSPLRVQLLGGAEDRRDPPGPEAGDPPR